MKVNMKRIHKPSVTMSWAAVFNARIPCQLGVYGKYLPIHNEIHTWTHTENNTYIHMHAYEDNKYMHVNAYIPWRDAYEIMIIIVM